VLYLYLLVGMVRLRYLRYYCDNKRSSLYIIQHNGTCPSFVCGGKSCAQCGLNIEVTYTIPARLNNRWDYKVVIAKRLWLEYEYPLEELFEVIL